MAIKPGSVNHLELNYRPGEKELARSLFELFGCETWDNSSGSLIWVDDVILLGEVRPEQLAFESEFAEYLKNKGEQHEGWKTYQSALRERPQAYNHFGIGYRRQENLEEALERVQKAAVEGPLAGRVELASVFYPEDPGSVGDHIIQSFVRTDIISAGLLTIGQTIELHHFFSNDSRRSRSAWYVPNARTAV